MRLNFVTVMSIFGIVSSWATQALADGKISLAEALNLVTQLAVALGLPTEFDVNSLLSTSIEEKEV